MFVGSVVKTKIHATIFLVTYTCLSETVEDFLTAALAEAGAQTISTQLTEWGQSSHKSQSLAAFVSRFSCSCTAHTAHCGAELLHRTYSVLARDFASAQPGHIRLLFATLIPIGHEELAKSTLSQICAQDLSYLLPLQAGAGAGGVGADVWECAGGSTVLKEVESGKLSKFVTVVVTTSPMRSVYIPSQCAR
jgi:hypothetical protein